MPSDVLLSAAWDKYSADVERIVRQRLDECVFPLLRRRRYRLLSGNGTFYLENRQGRQLDTDPRDHPRDPDLAEVLRVLNTEILGMPAMCLGAFGYDFPPSKET